MEAGRLRHKIEIKSAAYSKNTLGENVATWTTITNGRRWAEVKPLSGRERFTAQQVNADLTHRVTIRFMPGIAPEMRIDFGSRVFDIKEVINTDERNIELVMLCKEAV